MIKLQTLTPYCNKTDKNVIPVLFFQSDVTGCNGHVHMSSSVHGIILSSSAGLDLRLTKTQSYLLKQAKWTTDEVKTQQETRKSEIIK